jgi:hypothetical protein
MPAEITLTERFDLIVLSNLIGFTGDVQRVFEELKKVSHERSKIIVTYYNFLWEPIIRFAELIGIKEKTPRQNWLSQQDIKNLLSLAGFDTYRRVNSMLLPYDVPLLSNLVNRYTAKLPIRKPH